MTAWDHLVRGRKRERPKWPVRHWRERLAPLHTFNEELKILKPVHPFEADGPPQQIIVARVIPDGESMRYRAWPGDDASKARHAIEACYVHDRAVA